MLKKLLLGTLILTASTITQANSWVAGIGYMNVSESEDDMDINLGAITASLGYKFQVTDTLYIIPEVRLGTGVAKETINIWDVNVDIEIKSFSAISVKAQWELDNGLYFFAAPTYANLDIKATASYGGNSESASEDSNEFGLGGGIGYSFNESISTELMFETYEDLNALTVGVKFSF